MNNEPQHPSHINKHCARLFFWKNQNRSRLQKRWLAAANFKWITTVHFLQFASDSLRELCIYGPLYWYNVSYQRITCKPTFPRIYMPGIKTVFGHCFHFVWSKKSKGSLAKLTILFTELFKHSLNVHLFTFFFASKNNSARFVAEKKSKLYELLTQIFQIFLRFE